MDYKIELVDDEAWQMTCSLAEAWKCDSNETKGFRKDDEVDDVEVNGVATPLGDLDIDAIEDMRARNGLYYKIDQGSFGCWKEVENFNQLTAPYHEPFCLDIYVSKGSVRASIIHRATRKVVVVAHSISKDLKFGLSSTKSRSACAAVGEAADCAPNHY